MGSFFSAGQSVGGPGALRAWSPNHLIIHCTGVGSLRHLPNQCGISFPPFALGALTLSLWYGDTWFFSLCLPQFSRDLREVLCVLVEQTNKKKASVIVLSFPLFFLPLHCHNIAHPSTLMLTIFFEKCQGNFDFVAPTPLTF